MSNHFPTAPADYHVSGLAYGVQLRTADGDQLFPVDEYGYPLPWISFGFDTGTDADGNPTWSYGGAAGDPVVFASSADLSSGVSGYSIPVTEATSAGDGLAVAVGINGTAPPTVGAVFDSKGNSYTPVASFSNSTPYLFVWISTGGTRALTTSDTISVNLSGEATGTSSLIAVNAPGLSLLDVNSGVQIGTSTSPSASGIPASSGQLALSFFAWGSGGGSGSMTSPFTQIAQEEPTNVSYLTAGYDVSPASGTELTASDTITSAAWRAALITFAAFDQDAAEAEITSVIESTLAAAGLSGHSYCLVRFWTLESNTAVSGVYGPGWVGGTSFTPVISWGDIVSGTLLSD